MRKKTAQPQTADASIRQQAEAQWKKGHAGQARAAAPARAGALQAGRKANGRKASAGQAETAEADARDYPRAVYELEVHQIELELQNEELRRAQTELTGVRDDYQELYDFAPVGYITLDSHRVIRQANLTAATLLGVERRRLLGQHMERFAVKTERDALYLHLRDARDASQARHVPPPNRTCDLALRRGDGAEFFARLETAAVPSAGGDVGYRVVLADVTALREAQFARELSERRFRALTEKAADYITIVDAAGNITYENPTAHRTLGYAAGDLVGKSGFEFIHPDDLTGARRMLEEVARRPGGFAEVEFRVAARDGAWCWLHVLGTNLLDEPAVCGIVLNSRDVTDRRDAVEELRQMNEVLDQRVGERTEAIELLYDIASMANSAQEVTQAISYCLQRLTRYNGWRFGHALMPAAGGETMALACHCYPEGTERFAAFREATEITRFALGKGLVGRILASRAPAWTTRLSSELAGARAATAKKLALCTAVAFPVFVGERVVAVLELFSEQVLPLDHRTTNFMSGVGLQLGRVFERASLQEHLLTIADQMQQRIAQDLHDDVGQEMAGLGLKVETLVEGICPDDSRSGKLAADIMANVERARGKLRGIARRILPIEVELNLLPGALERLAADITVGSPAACTFYNAHPKASFDGRVATQLFRIAQEAVANAVRHGRARNIRIDLAGENGRTRLCITDDGCGISPASGGDGLGMRIMRYRAGLIGGTLEISPASVGGTIVTCLLPAGENDQPTTKRRRKPCLPKS